MATRDKRPSEFAGEPGLIQRGTDGFTHDLTSREYARMIRATNPEDATDTPEAARIREMERDGRG